MEDVLEEKKTTAQESKPQAKGPSKREKMITAILAVAFIIAVVVIALIQKANGAF